MKTFVMVDKVGRLVSPKDIREAIGVFGRMALSVEVVGHVAHLAVHDPARSTVARRRGRLVYSGELPKNWGSGEAVLQTRERRLRR